VLGGMQGIGKDTILEPVKYAIGPWNFAEASPQQVLSKYTAFVKSVILRISEARDLGGEHDRFEFYEHTKTFIVTPPDTLMVNEKYIREYSVFNVCGVIITTNHKAHGIYIDPDDRRHFVAWSDSTKEDFSPDYWTSLYRWFEQGGNRHVTAYLEGLDLSGFDPKAPPPKTAAWWEIVDSGRAPEETEMADALDELDNPAVVTLAMIIGRADSQLQNWLLDKRNARTAGLRLSKCGYSPVKNPGPDDGMWKVSGKRVRIYARNEMPTRDAIAAAEGLVAKTAPRR
jgi:hypothetical protein